MNKQALNDALANLGLPPDNQETHHPDLPPALLDLPAVPEDPAVSDIAAFPIQMERCRHLVELAWMRYYEFGDMADEMRARAEAVVAQDETLTNSAKRTAAKNELLDNDPAYQDALTRRHAWKRTVNLLEARHSRLERVYSVLLAWAL